MPYRTSAEAYPAAVKKAMRAAGQNTSQTIQHRDGDTQVRSWKFESWFRLIAARLVVTDPAQAVRWSEEGSEGNDARGSSQNMSCTFSSAAARGWKQNVMSTRSEPSVTSQCLLRAATDHTTKVLRNDQNEHSGEMI